MFHLLCDLEVLYIENIQLTLVRHFRTLLHFVRHYGIRHSGTNSSSLYDTPNQNVLLAVRRVYLTYQNVLLEFQRIACLSILQEFVYCQSLWSQIHLPVELDGSNPMGQLSNVAMLNIFMTSTRKIAKTESLSCLEAMSSFDVK